MFRPVGCGDAFFSISSVIYKTTKDPVISNFLANALWVYTERLYAINLLHLKKTL